MSKFEEINQDEVREDVQQLARELWCVNDQMKDRMAQKDEASQVLKSLKKRREELITKIAKCGQFVPAIARKSA